MNEILSYPKSPHAFIPSSEGWNYKKKTEMKCLYYTKQVSNIYIPLPEKNCYVRQTHGKNQFL